MFCSLLSTSTWLISLLQVVLLPILPPLLSPAYLPPPPPPSLPVILMLPITPCLSPFFITFCPLSIFLYPFSLSSSLPIPFPPLYIPCPCLRCVLSLPFFITSCPSPFFITSCPSPFFITSCPSGTLQVKNLRKQVLQFFKEYESLTDEVCVDRFFSLIAKFMSYDVEEFKRCAVEVRKSTGLLAEAQELLLNTYIIIDLGSLGTYVITYIRNTAYPHEDPSP